MTTIVFVELNLRNRAGMEPFQGRQDLETVFLEYLSRIEKIIAFIARKHGLYGAEADDFASIVKLKLIEDDYAVLRKFRGESSLPTFLAVVIAGIFHDYRVEKWGRWRPSATAKANGATAVLLETLIARDGYSTREAIDRLVSSHRCDVAERDLWALAARLPRRERLRPVEVDTESAEAQQLQGGDAISEVEKETLEKAIHLAVDELSGEDRLLVRMKFWEGLTVADISRVVGLPQKQLYRKLDKVVAQIRVRLRSAGVKREDVQDMLAG